MRQVQLDIIGNGKENNHFHLFMSSKRLIENLQQNGIEDFEYFYDSLI